MSVNQSKAEKNKSSQYRKSGRSGKSGQQRNSQGSSGKGGGGGGTAPPSSSPSSSSNRSFKKSNNARGGQSRVTGGIVNSDSNKASTARAVQNGAHSQPPLPGVSNAPVTGLTVKPTDVPTQKNTRGVPKAPSSGVTPVNPETIRPLTPGKGPGDASRSLPLQFGSIRPDFINGMQIPARTSSAPLNVDEQKRDQACHDSLKAMSTLSAPTGPQQQLPKKDAGAFDQSNNAEVHPMPKEKRNVQVSVGPTVTQTQKHSVHPISGVSMQVLFHQPQVPLQFGSPNPQMQGQGLTNTSLPMPMPMPVPVPVGNPSQVRQQVFVPGLQPHPMQSQGIMHQGQNLNFASQMGPQLPQLGDLGISIGPQFQQQQAGKFAVPRKTVKITHPDTHEELRLDKRTDTYMDGWSSDPRSLRMPPQSQPIPSYPPAHSINYYPNSYNPSSLFFPPQSSVPLISTQVTPSSQAPRFYNQASQGPPTVAFMNPSSLNSFTANKAGVPLRGIAEPSILEHGRDVHNVISLPQPASVQVTVQPAVSSHGEKDKLLLEPIKAKNTMGKCKKKKKRKELLQKADAAGTSFDLYMAYNKGPEKAELVETGALETTQRKLGKPINVGNVMPSASTTGDALNADKSSTSDASLSRCVGVGSKEATATGSAMLDQGSPIVSIPSLSEATVGREGEGTESTTNGVLSPSVSGSKDKPLLEPNKAKNTMGKWKKKKKKILQKRKERTESISSKQVSAVVSWDVVSNEKSGHSKAELDDWEDAADISTPKLESPNNGKQSREGVKQGEDGNGVLAKKYSRDFLLKFSDQYTDLPEGFKITPNTPEAFIVSNVNISRDFPSPRRIMQRNSADSDRWQHATGFQKGLLPSPHTPLQVMHKAERKYEIGEVTDEEQAKQRQLKGILNKLTPQNFEKLFEQVKQVNIDNAGTLTA